MASIIIPEIKLINRFLFAIAFIIKELFSEVIKENNNSGNPRPRPKKIKFKIE